MAAAGVCHSDLHVVDGEWERPTGVVMGHEGAAWVEELGEGVSDLGVGDLVVLAWTAPCGSCESCRAQRALAVQRDPMAAVIGWRPSWSGCTVRNGEAIGAYSGIGTFGERQVVAASAAIKVDPRTPPEIAALIGCAVTTGIGAVRNTANVQAGESVVVIGPGGVGLSAVIGAVAQGAQPGHRHRHVAGEARAGHPSRRPPSPARQRGGSGPRGRSRARVHRSGRDRRARDRARATGRHCHARRDDAAGAARELRRLPIRRGRQDGSRLELWLGGSREGLPGHRRGVSRGHVATRPADLRAHRPRRAGRRVRRDAPRRWRATE